MRRAFWALTTQQIVQAGDIWKEGDLRFYLYDVSAKGRVYARTYSPQQHVKALQCDVARLEEQLASQAALTERQTGFMSAAHKALAVLMKHSSCTCEECQAIELQYWYLRDGRAFAGVVMEELSP